MNLIFYGSDPYEQTALAHHSKSLFNEATEKQTNYISFEQWAAVLLQLSPIMWPEKIAAGRPNSHTAHAKLREALMNGLSPYEGIPWPRLDHNDSLDSIPSRMFSAAAGTWAYSQE